MKKRSPGRNPNDGGRQPETFARKPNPPKISDPYDIRTTTSADRELDDLPDRVQAQLDQAIDGLAFDPRPSNHKKLSGFPGLYRLSLPPFRVIYHIDDKKRLILVLRISTRAKAYQNLKSLLKRI